MKRAGAINGILIMKKAMKREFEDMNRERREI